MIESPSHAGNTVWHEVTHFTTPPTARRHPRKRSVLKYRSASWPAMNGEAMAPIEPARPRISPIWEPVNPRPPSLDEAERYRPASGSHAPHTAYWRNIIKERRRMISLRMIIKGLFLLFTNQGSSITSAATSPCRLLEQIGPDPVAGTRASC